MSRAREIALLTSISKPAILGKLPVVPPSAPVLQYERMSDGRVRIENPGPVSGKEAEALATQLEAIAINQAQDIARLSAARDKRARKTQRRLK